MQIELVLQLLMPCLRRLAGTMMRMRRPRSAQRCEMTRPASIVSLTQAHLIRQEDAARKWVLTSEQRGIGLVRVEVNL